MRVLHVYAGNLFGGVETFLITLAKCRNECPGMEPHFALCFEGRLSVELGKLGVPVHRLSPARVSRPWTILRARRDLARLLRKADFDVVVCHGCWVQALLGPVVRKAGKRLVFWCHDILNGKNWLERWAGHVRPDQIITNSRFAAVSVGSVYPRRECAVVYYPVLAPNVADPLLIRERIRKERGVSADTRVILQVSRMEPWKGHKNLVRTLAEIKDHPGWVCWIVGGAQRPGERKYLAELQKMVHCLGLEERIVFFGQRHDVAELMCAADVFCQFNASPEPFGIVFIEALYAGLFIFSVRTGPMQELYGDYRGARLLSPGDPKEAAFAIKDFLEKRIQAPSVDEIRGKARSLCSPARQLEQCRRAIEGR